LLRLFPPDAPADGPPGPLAAQALKRATADLCCPSRNEFGKSIIVQSVTDRDDHAARLRDRAARLFAVALRAREDGNDQYAEELTLLASEAIDQATDLESRAPQATRAMPRVAQQIQQPQSTHGRRKSRIKK
jgi:hypothetical protein